MIQKNITYFGQQIVVACDEKCNKAWGMNSRPKIKFDDTNEDDYAYLSDDELDEAPKNYLFIVSLIFSLSQY